MPTITAPHAGDDQPRFTYVWNGRGFTAVKLTRDRVLLALKPEQTYLAEKAFAEHVDAALAHLDDKAA